MRDFTSLAGGSVLEKLRMSTVSPSEPVTVMVFGGFALVVMLRYLRASDPSPVNTGGLARTGKHGTLEAALRLQHLDQPHLASELLLPVLR
ncbi:hypothetical protein GCM10009795_026360 [Nocardioides hankookensis]